MKSLMLVVATAALAMPAVAADTKAPPVDRAVAVARAAQFHDQVEAALTKKPNDLYLAALTGSANDQWVWGLALVATRYDTTSVPAPILATFKAYNAKVDAARAAYEKKHPKEDVSDKPMDFFVPATPEEVQAVRLVHAINSHEDWLDQARRGGIDGAVLDQSVQCLEGVKGVVDAEDLMMQLIGVSATLPEEGKKGAKASADTVDMAALLSTPKDDASKSDEERDEEALCGGSDAFQHVKGLMKAVYTPPFKITVTAGKK